MKLRNKKIIIPVGIAVVLSIVGTVGALNGWFGGGNKIPSDTFTRGLVGYWSFDESVGTTSYDNSGNGKDGTWSPSSSSTIDKQVGTSTDDGYTNSGWFAPDEPQLTIGYTEGIWNAWCRFTEITIPQFSTINVAYVSYYEWVSSGMPLTKIYADDQINPTAPTNWTDYNTRNITTEAVDQDGVPGGSGWWNTNSIVNIIQELVNSYNYSNGAIQILHKDDGSVNDGDSYYVISWDGGYAPKLHIEYTLPLDLAWAKGKIGGALKFGGNGGYVGLGDVYDGVKSVEFWVNPSTSTEKVLDLNGTAYVEISGGNITATGWSDPEVYVNGKEDSAITVNAWNHVAITTNTGLNASSTYFGKVSSDRFSGSLDEVKFYSRALSAAEVRFHYNRGGPVAHWKFDEGSGSAIYDSGDMNNDGTLYGGMATSATAGSGWAAGKYGSALAFDGVDDYAEASDNSTLDATDGVTLEAWVKNPSGIGGTDNYEDWIAYTEVDPSGVLTVASNTITITDMTRNNGNWVYKDMGNGYFGTNFLHTFSADVSKVGYESELMVWAVTNVQNPNVTTSPRIFVWINSERRIYLSIADGNIIQSAYTGSGFISTGTQYWFTVERGNGSGSTTCKVYNDAARTSLRGTLSVPQGTTSFRFMVNAFSRETGSNSNQTSGHIYGLDIGEGVAFGKGNGAYQLKIAGRAVVSGTINNQNINAPIPDQNWHHLVLSYDKSKIRLYVDGQEKSYYSTTSAINTNATNLKIGEKLSGLIDDVRIYNYARTPDEIRLDYNAGFAALFGPQTGCDEDPGACMTQGLVGYWGFEDGSGQTAVDLSGNGNNGQLGSTTASDAGDPQWVTGKAGGALSFGGIDDYVQVPDSDALDITGSLTVSVWVKNKKSYIDGTWPRIINKKQNWDDANGWEIGLPDPYATGIQGGVTIIGSGGTAIQVTNCVSDWESTDLDRWVYITVVIEGTAAKLYCDGAYKGGGTIDAIAENNRPLYFGRIETEAEQYWYGAIDEVRIYSRALSPTEIRYHYNGGGPVAHWKFDEGSGSVAYDATENNNDGIIYGGMATSTAANSGWKAGKFGTALSFDGVNDYVSISNNVVTANQFTLSAWAMMNNIGGVSGQNIIFTQRDDTTGLVEIIFGAEGGTGFSFLCLRSTSGAEQCTGAPSPGYNKWHYYTAVVSSADIIFYIDAIEKGRITNSQTGNYTTGVDYIDIGRHRYSGGNVGFFNGLIDDVRIYNYARTPDEIHLDYNAGFAALFGPQTGCDEDPGACMTQGLVGYWGFEDNSGQTAYDASAYGNNGRLGSTTASDAGDPKWAKGKVGGGMLFGGTDDYVEVNNNSSLNMTGAITLETWININEVTEYGRIISKEGSGDGLNYLLLARGNSDAFMMNVNGNVAVSYVPLWGNEGYWFHVVGTYDRANIKIYVNGMLQDSTPYTVAIATSSVNLNIGRSSLDPIPSEYVNAFLDEVRIYNRALSAAEVSYHYNRGGPIAQWKFDEGSGNIAYDSTENNNDGIIYGGAATSTAANSGWKEGKYGTALALDGTDDYIEVANAPILTAMGSISLEGWVKFDAPIPYQYGRAIFSKTDDYGIAVVSSSSAAFILFMLENSYLEAFPINIAVGKWHHVAVTWDGSVAKIFFDGVEKTRGACTETLIDDGYPLYLVGAGPSDMTIDDVRIYGYARTPAQIQQDYNGGMSSYFR